MEWLKRLQPHARGPGDARLRGRRAISASSGAPTASSSSRPDAYDRIGPLMPVIAAMWHGQHFMIHFAKRPQDRAASLVSRSGDGELNAIALRHLGVRAIRGSGARGRDVREKGGVAATARDAARARERRDGGADRRRPEDRARLRRGHRHAGAAFRPADRAGRGGDEPAHRLQELGPLEPRPALRPRRDGARRADLRRRRRRRARRSRRRAARSSASSTASTSAPTRSSATTDPGAGIGLHGRRMRARRMSAAAAAAAPRSTAAASSRSSRRRRGPAAWRSAAARRTGERLGERRGIAGRRAPARPPRLAARRQHRRDARAPAGGRAPDPARPARARHLRHPRPRPSSSPAACRPAPCTSSCRSTCRATCAASSTTGGRTSRSSPNPRSGRTPSSSSSGAASRWSSSTAACRSAPSGAGRALPHVARALLERFALCLAQTPGRRRAALSRLGAPRVGGRRQPQVRREPAARRPPRRRPALRPALRPAGLGRGQHPSGRGGAWRSPRHQALAGRFPGLLTVRRAAPSPARRRDRRARPPRRA